MSIAVEHERFILAAKLLSEDILSPIGGYGKLWADTFPSGGSS